MTRILVAIALVVLLAGPAWANPPKEDRLVELMQFAATVLDVDHRGVELPPIIYMGKDQMQLMVYGVEMFNRINNTDGVSMADVLALYDPEVQIMYLNSDKDYSRAELEFHLVHELTHHLQAVHGHYQKAPCVRHLEHDAYRASNLWVMATGKGDITDPFNVFVRASCGGDG